MRDLPKDGIEDLCARARRSELEEGERRRLRLLLDTSIEARLIYRAGLELDAERSVLAGDDAMTERVIRRVLASRPKGRRLRVSWGLAAAAVCFAAVAAAGTTGVIVVQRGFFRGGKSPDDGAQVPAMPTPARLSAPAVSAAPVAAGATVALEIVPPEPGVADSIAAPSSISRQPAAGRSTGGRSHDAIDAGELFASASLARREGDREKAIVLYDALQSRYPSAPESRAADIALGMLQLQRPAPAAALRHFRRYLQDTPHGDLAPEASWGEADALGTLGRSEDARRSLTTLLKKYPESAYAKAARAKLESQTSAP